MLSIAQRKVNREPARNKTVTYGQFKNGLVAQSLTWNKIEIN